jgi:hypothetical protein
MLKDPQWARLSLDINVPWRHSLDTQRHILSILSRSTSANVRCYIGWRLRNRKTKEKHDEKPKSDKRKHANTNIQKNKTSYWHFRPHTHVMWHVIRHMWSYVLLRKCGKVLCNSQIHLLLRQFFIIPQTNYPYFYGCQRQAQSAPQTFGMSLQLLDPSRGDLAWQMECPPGRSVIDWEMCTTPPTSTLVVLPRRPLLKGIYLGIFFFWNPPRIRKGRAPFCVCVRARWLAFRFVVMCPPRCMWLWR